MCEECSICYEKNPRCRLVCGHTFHHACIKEWYMAGNNTGCPMCRNNIYFKGMRKYKQKWNTERREKLFADVYSEAVDDLLEDTRDSPFLNFFFKRAFEDLEEDYIKFKAIVDDPEDLRYLLNNPGDFIDNVCNIPIYHEPTNRSKVPKTYKKQKNTRGYSRRRT